MVRLTAFAEAAAVKKADATGTSHDGSLASVVSGFSRTNVALICIDRFPGVERFIGLGQLTAAQLATLVDKRQPVTNEQCTLATRAWSAFRSPDPTELVEMASPSLQSPVVSPQSPDLPFLRAALKRFLEEYPSTTNGLSRSADAVLRELEAGPRSGGHLFVATQAREPCPFMGDRSLFDVVRALGQGRVPLVTIQPVDDTIDLRQHTITITDAGREVVAGRQDAIALNGIDIWRGGVHLVAAAGTDAKLRSREGGWRWDARRETLI